MTVSFLDGPEAALRSRILQHMNAWNATANALFVETSGQAQVRIARQDGLNGGFWSFLGTDILSIEADQPTMNLEGFTMDTPESEYHRVVRHETGHTMGFPHEHMRKELVDKIDPEKAIEFFGRTQGWSPDEVRQQVLTPLETSSLLGTPTADPNSIMCYQIPGSITKDGQPIVVSHSVPLGETEVERHEHVHAVDGEIGQVEGFVVDSADHAVTHVILKEGHLWGRKQVAIPVSAVASVADGIRLNITKEQVGNLPPVSADGT